MTEQTMKELLVKKEEMMEKLCDYLDDVDYKGYDENGNKLPWVPPDDEGDKLMKGVISIQIEIEKRESTFEIIEVSIRERQPIRKMSAKEADLLEDPDCENRVIYVSDRKFEDVEKYWNEFMQTVYTRDMEFREDEMTMCMTRQGYGPCPCCGEFIGYSGERD